MVDYINNMIESGEIELVKLHELITLHIGVETPGAMTHCIAVQIIAGMSTIGIVGFNTPRFCSIGTVAHHINRNPQWVGRVMRMLESDGFVCRQPQDDTTLRYDYWRLTSKAFAWLEKSRVVVFSNDRGRVLRYTDYESTCN